jgi:predicted MPP superfamily phosphohydrolase
MKITVINDIHLEFDKNPIVKLTGGDVLLLPGDIVVAKPLTIKRTDKIARKLRRITDPFFLEECAKFEKVYMIMGNHEHYNNIFDYTAEILREYFEDIGAKNVVLLDKEFVALNDEWQLFGGTLWTDYKNNDWFARHAAQDKMNDHTIISRVSATINPYGERIGKFLPHDAFVEHSKTLEALQTGLYEWTQIDKKTIVMTHHAPTFMSIHPRFAGDVLNYAYASDLSDFIMDNQNIEYWFHGHTHDTHDYMVGHCRVICNPRGYFDSETNANFNPDFTVEI